MAKEGPILVKKLLNFVAITVLSVYVPLESFIVVKCCGVSFLEMTCLITHQVFFRFEVIEVSLSWKYFFLAVLIRKLYLLRYELYRDLLIEVGLRRYCLYRECFLLQEAKRPLENQGLEKW